MIHTIIDTRTGRVSGYSTVDYSGAKYEKTIESTEEDLSAVFKSAKSNGQTLDGAEASIDAAIEDPLPFLDYLILVDGSIEFDDAYVREDPSSTTS